MEEEEEEDRRQRQKREEEEFTRLPEDTTNMDQYDLSAATDKNATDADLLKDSKKRKKKKRDKNKNNNDDVTELAYGVTPTDGTASEMGQTTSQMGAYDTEGPLKSKKEKKRKRKDKNKAKQDDVEEISMDASRKGPAKSNKDSANDEDYIVAGDLPSTTDKEKAGKKTKGSSDEPSGNSSSSDKKKGKKKKTKDRKTD